MSEMTIFISPKGFDRAHIALIQMNAIRSWKAKFVDRKSVV